MGDEVWLNHINGKWVPAASGKTFENVNPANTSEVIGAFPFSGPEDVDAAVRSARSAHKDWAALPPPRRGEILYRAGRILQERKEDLAVLMTREMGKPLKETRGDVQEAIDMAFYTAGEGRRLFGQTVPSELANKFCMSVRQPVGVCALITPWNFPMAIPAWKVFPALICGNTAVLKPASDTPASAARLVQILLEAGLPPKALQLVYGSGTGAGSALVRHADVDLVSFTGSSEVGKEIGVVCSQNHKKVCLEMGGKNAQIVLADADFDLALEGVLWGAFGTTGQRCTATSRLIIEKRAAAGFVRELLKRVKNMMVGDGLQSQTQMGPLINKNQLKKVSNYVKIGLQEGSRLAAGGHAMTRGEYARGCFFEPTVFTKVSPSMRIAQEEIFGPVLSVIEVPNLDEAVEVANGTTYGLSVSIYTRDANKAFRAVQEIRSGIVYVNAPTIGAEVQMPFGGIKHSGNGHREAGVTALDIFSEWKTIFVDYSAKLQKAQMD